MAEITLFFYVQMQDTSMSRPFIKCLFADKILFKKIQVTPFLNVYLKNAQKFCVYTHTHTYIK